MPSYEGFQSSGRTPLRVYGPQPTYKTYVSPYGPKTKHVPNLLGLTPLKAFRYGAIASGYGIAAGLIAVFFLGDVPRVRHDILQNIPVVGGLFVKEEIAPEDNPF
ncbi:hypothetical protein A1O3_07003 [Capronia epimyces CBS 606.96]|uniref:Ubiquinol-cytochrome c reductase subunit 10 n=1 Tax=Capronia epimyces CBS 606.96 TaxID=1182542 RepID=W9YEI6_9EURO|nr:uncharacterized protein A1O3_07003 [Capronia epimyces CBS 606.96]EXJ80719.1 hypothetical protein A1O3_07003 [Capronia epimyces CBS 606.96]